MLRRTRLDLNQIIRMPVTYDVTGPVCALCGRVVDSETLVDVEPGHEDDEGRVTKNASKPYARILVKHHGAEEVRDVDMGSVEWGPSELKKRMGQMRWFEPKMDGESVSRPTATVPAATDGGPLIVLP